MNNEGLTRNNREPCRGRHGIPVRLTAFLLLASLYAGTMGSPALAAPRAESKPGPLGDDPTIAIGVAADLTGSLAYLGWQQANSVQLAVDQANAAGGIDIGGVTYTLNLVTADSAAGTACNPVQAVTAASTLLSAGVVAVVGHTCSIESMAAQPNYNAAGVAMVAPSSTNPQLTQQGYNTTFRTVPHDGTPPALLATHFRTWLGLSQSAIVEGPDALWGTQPGDVYQNTFTSSGGTITSRRQVSGTSEFGTVLTAIQAESPDAIVYLDPDPDRAGQFSMTAYDLGMTNVVIGWTPWDNNETLLDTYATAAGSSAAQGDHVAMQYRRSYNMPGWSSFLADYQAAGFANEPNDPGVYGPYAYDAARIIIAAIGRAGSTAPADIRDAIASTANHRGVVGTYVQFDLNGDAVPQWAWLERYDNGTWLDTPPSISIGVATAITGLPEFGGRQVNAVQLAVEQVNAGGGIDVGGTHSPVELVFADGGCDATKGIAAANTLLGAGVVAAVAHSCSAEVRAAQHIYNSAGVPMISPSSTVPDVTDPGYNTTFRVMSRDDAPPILLATHFRNWLNLPKAAIVTMQDAAPAFVDDAFADTFISLGGTITSRRTVTSTAQFTSVLTAIQAEDADVIFYGDPDPDNAGFLSSTAHGLGMTDVIIAWNTGSLDGSVLAEYAAQAGTAAEGDYAGMSYRNSADMPGYNTLNADYVAAGFPNYGNFADIWGAYAYDAARIIFAAIDRANSTSPAAIRSQIAATTDYEGVVGTYVGFDSRGEVIPQWAWLERYSGGDWEIPHPAKVFLPLILKNAAP